METKKGSSVNRENDGAGHAEFIRMNLRKRKDRPVSVTDFRPLPQQEPRLVPFVADSWRI
jgi:hypothetical protein